MRVPIQISEESLFGFLTSTRLPLVSSLASLIRWASLGQAVACAVFAVLCLCIADAVAVLNNGKPILYPEVHRFLGTMQRITSEMPKVPPEERFP